MIQALRERSMAKRQRVIRERDIKAQHCSIDRISTLPDETLLFILSLLSMEDSAKTSLLSRRWRYLWSFTPTLDFDGTPFLLKVASAVKTGRSFFNYSNERRTVDRALEEQRRKYVGWVDSVIASHKAYAVERFRLFFNLTKFHQKHIDAWLRHAVAKKVRTLEVDLTKDCSTRGLEYGYSEYYKFPCELLRGGSVDFKFLEKLCTNCVSVNGEAVEFFLRNCPRLEHVSICQSGDLTSLKIIKPFPALKRLEISLCNNLDSVEIRDAGVVYLRYFGMKIRRFVLENVPLLTQLCIEGPLIMSMADVLLTFSKHFPQLEILKMCNLYGYFSMEDTELFYSTTKLTCLKELVVKYSSRPDISWLSLANIVRAAPYLQRFVVEQWFRTPGIFGETKFEKIVRLCPHLKGFEKIVGVYPHLKEFEKIVGVYPHLKEFEFVGYSGATSEVYLIKQLLHGASSLEKIIVDPRVVLTESPLIMFHNMWMKRVLDDQIDGRARAKQQLPKIVPPGIVLEIL